MKYIKIIIWAVIFIPAFVLAFAFGTQNLEPVSINLIFHTFSSVKLGFALLAVFITGLILGAAFFGLPGLASNLQNRKLKKDLHSHKQELGRLKSAGFHESS